MGMDMGREGTWVCQACFCACIGRITFGVKPFNIYLFDINARDPLIFHF